MCIYIVLIFLHILVLCEFWVLTESRIPLKLVLQGVRIVAYSIIFHVVFSLFLKDQFFPDYLKLILPKDSDPVHLTLQS